MTGFDRMVEAMEAEMLELKTAHLKTASAFETEVRQVSARFELAMAQGPDPYVYSTEAAIVTVAAEDGLDFLSSCTLHSLEQAAGREIFIKRLPSMAWNDQSEEYEPEQGVVKYWIGAQSGNSEDIEALLNGETVEFSLDIDVIATSAVTATLNYEEADNPYE